MTDFADFYAGLTYTPSDVRASGTLVLRSSNVSNGEIVDADNVYVDSAAANSESVQQGDIIVVVRNGSRALIGKHAQIKRFMPDTVIGAFMTGIRSDCPEFTNALLNTPHFDEEVAMNMGATINQITGYMFSKMEFAIPTTAEQKKIGTFFENLDNLITLHQRMCAFFGSTLQIRMDYPLAFAWEQRKLGDVCNSFEYGLNAAATTYDGKNKYLRITDIDDSSHKFNYDDLTSPDTDIDSADSYRLAEGDILFARTGASVGKTYLYRYFDGLVYFAGFLIRAKIRPEYDAEFVFQNTLTDEYGKFIRITSQRSGQPGVNAQEYGEYAFSVPKEAEQRRIGAFFRNLDDLITLHQRELKHTKNNK